MAITIDASVGGAASNSFVTLAELTTHMEGRLNSDSFDDATTDDQNRALAEATRELSSLSWAGVRTDDTQALAWPRDLVRNPDDPNHNYFADDVIPARIKRATYELAFEFLKAGTIDIVGEDKSLNLSATGIDVIRTEYVPRSIRLTGVARYPAVHREIRPLLASASRMTVDVGRS